jgi:hypothetical protein
MSYDVHLSIVGDSPDAVFGVLRSDRAVDRIYLLCDGDEIHMQVLERIMSGLEAVGIDDVIDISIDPTDYHGTFQTVVSILEDERSAHEDALFHLNFSSGDSVSVIAMRNAVESFNSDQFYLLNGKAVSMTSESVVDITSLRIQTKVLDTFMRFKGSEVQSNSDLKGKLSAPALSYRTKELERMGLIRSEGSYRNLSWALTPKGKQMLKRF